MPKKPADAGKPHHNTGNRYAAKNDEPLARQYHMVMTQAQFDKLKQLGSAAWIRQQIDKS